LDAHNEITEGALAVLAAEKEGISQLMEAFPPDFPLLVEKILASQGRLVLTGIGKSALIAQKITATLNSTGTPAVFLHAADAIHGDLGMVQEGEPVLFLSHSGNTPEITYLAQLVHKMGNPMACITGNPRSALAQKCSYHLCYAIAREACPLNLAPTTSTTLQLVLGDALAVALLSSRKFGASDFSRFHPGGSLGKKLYLTCGELAAKNQRPAVNPNDSFQLVVMEISAKRLGATAVLDDKQVPVGVITDGDIRRVLEKQRDLHALTAKDMMGKHPKTIDADCLAVTAVDLFQQHSITQLIVVNKLNGIYEGFIHLHDLHAEGLL
jgi:arabinose-5-phosphate isomerase